MCVLVVMESCVWVNNAVIGRFCAAESYSILFLIFSQFGWMSYGIKGEKGVVFKRDLV
jgi:hypothetical protein